MVVNTLRSWNGLKSKSVEFDDFLIKNNIDIALVNETHLKSDDDLQFRGYQVHRDDEVGAVKPM